MKKTRKRVKGRIAGLCSTYIASLAGVAPVTVRRWRKSIKGEVSLQQLRGFLFECEAKRLAQVIREVVGIDMSLQLDNLLQREGPQHPSNRRNS